ncbi:hypothetical protein ABPG75_006568 [Micractinium tetrahymenae]
MHLLTGRSSRATSCPAQLLSRGTPAPPRPAAVHDQVNLLLLPILGGLTIAGLTGHVAPELVTHLFLGYVLADMAWVFLIPDAVPSLPGVILLHHFVTACLLCIPLRYPHLHTYTCIDGLVELNTFFLIARRQCHSLRKFFSLAYWGSFVPMRLVVYPALVPVFLSEMRAARAGWWDTLVCVGAQVVLTCFNIMLLALSLMNRSKRRSEASAADAKGGGGGAKLAAAGRLRPGSDGVVDGMIKAAPGGSVESGEVRLRARAV